MCGIRLFRNSLTAAQAGLLGVFCVVFAPAPAAAGALPDSPEKLVASLRQAIETKDYQWFDDMVLWDGAGKIKRRILRFQINRGLGRPVGDVSFEPFPETGLDSALATGKLVVNMPVTHRVRVTYDEPPLNATGKRPASVFLVGRKGHVYRFALVVRKPGADDDD